jgi:ribosome-associated toxin RatA of RatAB toxin-antitoxin module
MTGCIQCQALVLRPAAHVFDVIEAAELYPQFLPWCADATILQRDEQVVVARLTVAWRQVRFSFVTRNPKRRPEWMAIGLEEGPFRRFAGTWQLTALAEWGCRVEFMLDYEFNASLLDPLAGPVFQRSTSQLVDAFVRRAEHLHPEVPLPSSPEKPP